jgi:hypothetical protein
VGAFEETKCRRSVVSDTYHCLTELANSWRQKIDLLEAGQMLDREEATSELKQLLDACQNLRGAILSEDSGASWTTTSELKSLVQRLDEAAEKRNRYLDLAQFLAAGTVSHRRERTRQDRLRERDAAVAELMEISAMPAPPDLPGPSAEEWLNWACNLDDSTDDPDLAVLKANFPRVDDFVSQLEIENWHNGSVTHTDHILNDAVPAFATKSPELPEAEEAQGAMETTLPNEEISIPNAVSLESVMSEAPVPELAIYEAPLPESAIPEAPAPEATIESVVGDQPEGNVAPASDAVMDLQESIPIETAETSVATEEETETAGEEITHFPEPPKPLWHDFQNLRHLVNRGLSFFDEEEVEYFRRYLDEAKSEPKTVRSVRSLLAISQWLQPSDQNPVLHTTYGIRSQVGYAGTSDLEPMSPQDAARVIEADSGLLLLTGGADLLRWSIAQRAEGHFDAIAAVRRLTIEQVKGWFGEVFKIELAEPQVLDVYKLTSGIPLLMGELHKLVLPNPKTPPTWLGFQIWTSVKAGFEHRLPALARELRTGAPAIRLTEQEIRVLKMVVTASDDSNPDTILRNLREDWEKYNKPEFPALSAKDEPRVRLLESLGLLPMRHGEGLGPVQAILPVDGDDALRQIVSYL